MNKSALLLGSTGLVGSELLEQLKPHYDRIIVLTRKLDRTATAPIEQHMVDFNKLDDVADLFKVDDVYCCLGTTIRVAKTQEAFREVDYTYPLKAAQLAKAANANQFLIVTAMGADPRSSIFYSRVKGELEQSLLELSLPSLHIFRPSLLLGQRKQLRIVERIAIAMNPLLRFIMSGPLRRYRPIHASIVARGMWAAARSNSYGSHIYSSHEIEQLALSQESN